MKTSIKERDMVFILTQHAITYAKDRQDVIRYIMIQQQINAIFILILTIQTHILMFYLQHGLHLGRFNISVHTDVDTMAIDGMMDTGVTVAFAPCNTNFRLRLRRNATITSSRASADGL